MPADDDGSYAGHFEKRAVVEMKVDYREENIRDNEQTTLVSIDDSPMKERTKGQSPVVTRTHPFVQSDPIRTGPVRSGLSVRQSPLR
uniref:Uncharacterized protein n=1 Tax=Vespula pensylvanica TaxID=30213 RepID=A0A834JIV4_VESPE|nr:hypothetical protein H0235_018032 [Vespula pensylvanica]